MQPFYPDNGDRDPDAVPGVAPREIAESDSASFTLEVAGELFLVEPDGRGGSGYTWLSGPNPGYGFAVSPTRDVTLRQHRQHVRDFLAEIDPATGYLSEA